MKIIDAKTPKWANETKTTIDLLVLFEELQGEGYLGFTASPTDIYGHGVALYNRAVAGEFGVVGKYVPEQSLTPPSGQIPTTNTGE